MSGDLVKPNPMPNTSNPVGIKIEIHEIHQNLRNPVSTLI